MAGGSAEGGEGATVESCLSHLTPCSAAKRWAVERWSPVASAGSFLLNRKGKQQNVKLTEARKYQN